MIRRGDRFEIGPLRILVTNMGPSHETAHIHVYYGTICHLGSDFMVPIAKLEEVKADLENQKNIEVKFH